MGKQFPNGLWQVLWLFTSWKCVQNAVPAVKSYEWQGSVRELIIEVAYNLAADISTSTHYHNDYMEKLWES